MDEAASSRHALSHSGGIYLCSPFAAGHLGATNEHSPRQYKNVWTVPQNTGVIVRTQTSTIQMHLSVLDLCLNCPKSIYNSLSNKNPIFFLDCIAQLFPVHLVYGSNVVPQFFSDVSTLLKISCSQDQVATHVNMSTAVALAVVCFMVIIDSYLRIFWALLKITATECQAKAFFTCLLQLTVFVAFFYTWTFAYLKPPSDCPSTLDLLTSVLYTVVPPAHNPLIYSLKNKDMKTALGRS
ncbi:olfactory receptor 14A2-like [Tachyglossus aculeatus]|uniref:olfactory receptor 14A2-like n=1 Tax=Tachyglossus aculeatus TaxID=9261 RepID=UPI0018F31623|nr:olfactory receptor 14A2-like [Tachyglossus aculeatus]